MNIFVRVLMFDVIEILLKFWAEEVLGLRCETDFFFCILYFVLYSYFVSIVRTTPLYAYSHIELTTILVDNSNKKEDDPQASY